MGNRVAARQPDLGPLSLPPADLGTRTLPTIAVERTWYRFHSCARTSIFFNRQDVNRFNAPSGEYGTVYLGRDPACCFVETFGRLDSAMSTTVRSVSRTQLLDACLSEIIQTRQLHLVDLTGPGLRRLDADSRLFAGEHPVARQWGLALWGHPSQPDGILFPARPGRSVRCRTPSSAPSSTATTSACGRSSECGAVVGAYRDTPLRRRRTDAKCDALTGPPPSRRR